MIRLADETDSEYALRKAQASPFFGPMRTLYARAIGELLKKNDVLSNTLRAGRVRAVAREIARSPL